MRLRKYLRYMEVVNLFLIKIKPIRTFSCKLCTQCRQMSNTAKILILFVNKLIFFSKNVYLIFTCK